MSYQQPKQQKLSVPFGLRLKTALALTFSAALLVIFFYFMYSIHWMLFALMAGIPAVALVIYRPNGIVLQRNDSPRLFSLLDDISAKLNVRIPKVLLTYNSEIAVTGIFSKKLLLGMGGILKLKQDELYSILVHEMAHLKGLDSVVGASLSSVSIAVSSVMRFFEKIPVWHAFMFLIYYGFAAYGFVYRLFNLAYTRQREYLADRYAAQLSGPKTFSTALTNYVINTAFFEQVALQAVINEGLKGKRHVNLYELYDKKVLKELLKKKRQLEKEILQQKGSVFDSHPSLFRRIFAVKDLPNRTVKYSGMAVSLLNNPAGKQKQLTEMITARIMSKTKIRKVGDQTIVEVPSSSVM